MNVLLRSALMTAGFGFATQAAAQIVFYEHDNFGGRSFTAEKQVANFESIGFNDRASSVVVLRDRWEVCTDARFGGSCKILRPGRYPSLGTLGMSDRVSSVRPVAQTARIDDARFAPASPMPVYDNHRRPNERLFDANVTAVRAMYGEPQQRCWVEREQVSHGGANVPGAVIGGLIGGVLGHQIGSGRGNDVATVGGAVAGAAIGANVGREGNSYARGDRRCDTVPASGKPHHWDVTYEFRGREHHIQTTLPPGQTIAVNAQGEPRS